MSQDYTGCLVMLDATERQVGVGRYKHRNLSYTGRRILSLPSSFQIVCLLQCELAISRALMDYACHESFHVREDMDQKLDNLLEPSMKAGILLIDFSLTICKEFS